MLAKRVLWHVNRSPAGKVIKSAMRIAGRRELSARRALARTLPVTEPGRAISESLAAKGYARADALLDPEYIRALDDAVTGKAEQGGGQSSVFGDHKKLWSHLLNAEMEEDGLPVDSAFARFAMQPALLSALAHYYGELPRLDYVALTLSRPTGEPFKYSQLWHRDHDDTKVVKLFVYLSDVDDPDGPFTFIPGPESDRLGFRRHSHQSDEAVGRVIDLDKAVRMKGPRLTAFLVETSRCLHMGSRLADGRERLMYTASYISAPRIFPERPKPFFKLRGDETPVERAVLLPG